MITNLIAAYVKMLYYDRFDASEGIRVNKINRLKKCISHYWYFLEATNMNQK